MAKCDVEAKPMGGCGALSLHASSKNLHEFHLWTSGSHQNGFVGNVSQRHEILTDIFLSCFCTGHVHHALRKKEMRKGGGGGGGGS